MALPEICWVKILQMDPFAGRGHGALSLEDPVHRSVLPFGELGGSQPGLCLAPIRCQFLTERNSSLVGSLSSIRSTPYRRNATGTLLPSETATLPLAVGSLGNFVRKAISRIPGARPFPWCLLHVFVGQRARGIKELLRRLCSCHLFWNGRPRG